MDEVSWPDHIVDFLLKNIKKQKGKHGSVPGCTTLLPVHEDFFDPVTQEELYLIDLLAPARKLQEEKQKNEEMTEELVYLECEKQEITYQRSGQAKTLMNNIIFLKNIIDTNRDTIHLKPADEEKLNDIAKQVKEWREKEENKKKARSESTQQ
ncbi:hypothetical protein C5167_034772 [Papaver somniferum]|uniref:Uncharacterized protein n=1 Tax=Papaver somniferum TaxID=3469 RepID=A0A4Y7KI67_PAPSO|nr:hypothetical protein C5167_034772 [Papaver somniferum]